MKNWERKGAITALLSPDWRESADKTHERVRAETTVRERQLYYKGVLLADKRCELDAELKGAESESILRIKRFHSFLWLFGFLLSTACGFLLALWALKPFTIGLEGFAIAGILTVAVVLGVEFFLSHLSRLVSERSYRSWILTFALIALLCGLLSTISLGKIRARELAWQGALNQQNSGVVIEGEESSHQDTKPSLTENFYREITSLSGPALIPLAVSADFVSGIALHQILAIGIPAWVILSLIRRRQRIKQQIASTAAAIEECKLLPDVAQRKYLEGGTRGEKLRNYFTEPPGKLLSLVLILLFLAFFLFLFLTVAFAQAQNMPDLVVVALDLTDSSKGEELKNNIRASEEVIITLKPGASLVVIPITGSSFSSPPLLEARLTANPGPFDEHLKAGKRRLLAVWRDKSKALKTAAQGTDIFGACAKAAVLCGESPTSQCHLIFLSDMRQASRGYMFENTSRVNPTLLQKVEKEGFIPPLQNVEVAVRGAHALNVTEQYWLSLREFWKSYFERAGAKLLSFSLQRRLP